MTVEPDHVWEELDRFGLMLRRCPDAKTEVTLTLAALAEALDADAVFWDLGHDDDMALFQGDWELPAAWRGQFIQWVVGADTREEVFIRHFLDRATRPTPLWPFSAVLARMGEADGRWLVALRLVPRHLFDERDLDVMRVARRLVLNHRQRSLIHEQFKDSLEGHVRRLTMVIEELLRSCRDDNAERLCEQVQVCRRQLDALCGAKPARSTTR